MKSFPPALKPENKGNFPCLLRERYKCYLRRDLYEHIIGKKETEYFSLDEFNNRVGNLSLVKELTKELVKELEEMGWKCALAFGDTGVFIYSGDMPDTLKALCDTEELS